MCKLGGMDGKLPSDEEELLDDWNAVWRLDAFGCLVSNKQCCAVL